MKTILLIGLIIYLSIGLLLYLQQRSFIYFPPAETSAALNQRVFQNEGHGIKVTVLNEDAEKAIIYFGGNAENVDYNVDEFSKWFSEYTVYLVKYRGYGGSSGTPTEKAIYSDALYIYDAIRNEHETLSIMGRSLGSAVATYIASKRAPSKLVLITPFDSIQRVAQSQFPLYPMSILLKDKHDSYSRAKAIKAETLVIAAELDSVIKMSHTKRLVEGFASEVLFHEIQGAGHNDISNYPDYYRVIDEFLSNHADTD